MSAVEFTLSFAGSRAELNQIDFYDVSQALVGFQRSLALTTHLIVNGKIITQAPALKGAQIVAIPPVAGSWKLPAVVLIGATAVYNIGTAPKDTPIGHLVRSGYDYVISEALGFHVDYDKSLGQQYEEMKKKLSSKEQSQARFDSLIEKCENSIREMHRPIIKSETASEARLVANLGEFELPIGPPLNRETYEYITFTDRRETPEQFIGKITSYNVNTFKGRVYVSTEGRPIPFELSESARGFGSISAITASLSANAHRRLEGQGEIVFTAFRNVSRTGRLKFLYITEVAKFN
jgi:hypothetical protein